MISKHNLTEKIKYIFTEINDISITEIINDKSLEGSHSVSFI